jgi:hypothetical protein
MKVEKEKLEVIRDFIDCVVDLYGKKIVRRESKIIREEIWVNIIVNSDKARKSTAIQVYETLVNRLEQKNLNYFLFTTNIDVVISDEFENISFTLKIK